MRIISNTALIWILGTIVPLLVWAGWPALERDMADVIFYNGDVITMEPVLGHVIPPPPPEIIVAQAMAIKGDKILAVGTDAEMFALQDASTVTVDLQGRTILPGFVEGHSHILWESGQGGASIEEAVDVALSFGWTTLNELNMSSFDARTLEIQSLADAGALRLRVNGFYSYNLASLDEEGNNHEIESYWKSNDPTLDPNKHFRIVGIKVFVDGAFTPARGCWAVSEPYPADFQASQFFMDTCRGEPQGSLYLAEDVLKKIVSEAHSKRFRVAFHAMGDRAIDVSLNAIEVALDGESNSNHRHQMHHNALLRDDQVARYQAMNMLATVRGTFLSCSPETWMSAFDDRFDLVVNRYDLPNQLQYPLLEGDFGWTSDPHNRFNVRPINPMQNLWGIVTRKQVNEDGSFCDPAAWMEEHMVSVEHGLWMLTMGPAYAVSMDEHIGSLKAGKFADFVIMEANPLEVKPDKIIDISHVATFVNGQVEYCHLGQEAFCPPTVTTGAEALTPNENRLSALEQNYPNPFSPETTIEYTVAGHSQHVRATVYDLMGREVKTLVDRRLSPGRYAITWDGRDDAGQSVAAGVYLYQLHAGDAVYTRQMVRIR